MEKTELDYRLELIRLVSYCSICRRENSDTWMLGLCKHINDILNFLDQKDRFEYDGFGLILTLKEGEIK